MKKKLISERSNAIMSPKLASQFLEFCNEMYYKNEYISSKDFNYLHLKFISHRMIKNYRNYQKSLKDWSDMIISDSKKDDFLSYCSEMDNADTSRIVSFWKFLHLWEAFAFKESWKLLGFLSQLFKFLNKS